MNFFLVRGIFNQFKFVQAIEILHPFTKWYAPFRFI